MNKIKLFSLVAAVLAAAGCATAMFNSSTTHINRENGLNQHVETEDRDTSSNQNDRTDTDNSMTGDATYYGEAFHGKRTASGETFNMYALTAAHRTLPFGTLVRVTNLENSKSVVVRINDRGPVDESIIIDLSYESARRIDLLSKGRVKIEILR